MKKKISIITINLNNLEGLKKTMNSVVNQAWQEFEYIVIDGDSTDGSTEYIESQKQYIDYWVSEPDKGIYNAMNKGIDIATGEYLLFLNSGDHFIDSYVLKRNHKDLNEFDLVYFDIEVKGQGKSKIFKYPSKLRFSDLYFGSLPHSATFIKKELFSKVGMYDESLKIASDWKFFLLALFLHKCSYKKIENIFSIFYLGGISTTEDNSMERFKVLNEYFSGYVLDYEELLLKRVVYEEYNNILSSKSFKLLNRIKKIVAILFK